MNIEYQQALLDLARESIRYGLDHASVLPVELKHFEACLTIEQASFVTLKIDGELRGCIGSLVAHRPLVLDVVENAYGAAFRDPRFTPLSEEEFNELHYHISILSTPQPMIVRSEADLLSQLNVGVDGLVLTEGRHRSTFLPAVWAQLPDKAEFLKHLKLKAGLPAVYWSDTIEWERYSVQEFSS